MSRMRSLTAVAAALVTLGPVTGCGEPGVGRAPPPSENASAPVTTPASVAPREPVAAFRNVGTATAYVGDERCATCHAEAAAGYREHAMARSFHPWTPETRIESVLETPIRHPRTGFDYSVIERDGALYQVETLAGTGGRTLHELARRIDHVMGSGAVARTYFTEENGRLFQLPLTWYREEGWDFSPGYELNNARFDRLLPDRCLACHGSYPETFPFLEGKYAELRPGIGCERCHGPGELHARERTGGAPEGDVDLTIVDPAALPLGLRLDLCEQCHVHTPVTVLREGHDAFDYVPSEPLDEHAAFFRATGSIDLVSHADRLRQSACFRATLESDRALECATCHDPHGPVPDRRTRSDPCRSCHPSAGLPPVEAQDDGSPAHDPAADCVGCHMPAVADRTVPHGQFTDHWIRVPDAPRPAGRGDDGPVEPYFERDRSGPEAAVYRSMGEIVYGTLAPDPDAVASGADALSRALGPDTPPGAPGSDTLPGAPRSDTTRASARFLLGLAYRELGRTGDAIRALEGARRAAPDRPQTLHALARAYEAADRDPAAIEPLYARALELQPALAWIRADHARFLVREGRLVEAEAEYRAALAERPGLAVAAFELGALLAGDGRLGEAGTAFREALRLDPTLAEGLAPLLEVRTRAGVVANVRVLGAPVGTLPLRDRGPASVRIVVERGGRPGIRFVNLPAGGSVRVLEAGGHPVRTLAADAEGGATSRPWDLQADDGEPIASGLYRARIGGTDPGGARITPQELVFGVVRPTGG